jgi:hypothetical protein
VTFQILHARAGQQRAASIRLTRAGGEAKLAEVLAKMGMTFDMLRTLASRH